MVINGLQHTVLISKQLNIIVVHLYMYNNCIKLNKYKNISNRCITTQSINIHYSFLCSSYVIYVTGHTFDYISIALGTF